MKPLKRGTWKGWKLVALKNSQSSRVFFRVWRTLLRSTCYIAKTFVFGSLRRCWFNCGNQVKMKASLWGVYEKTDSKDKKMIKKLLYNKVHSFFENLQWCKSKTMRLNKFVLSKKIQQQNSFFQRLQIIEVTVGCLCYLYWNFSWGRILVFIFLKRSEWRKLVSTCFSIVAAVFQFTRSVMHCSQTQ